MTIAISAIGLATAQGNTTNILDLRPPRIASELPWTPKPSNVSRVCYQASGIDSSLVGVARWRVLVKRAIDQIGGVGQTPLLVASCNGSAAEPWEDAFDYRLLLADTEWANERLPVFSSSCASGLHALYAARQLLSAGAIDEVLVLAADILAQSNHENFENLKVLAEKPGAPWQSTGTGFILGEAAVVIKLVRAQSDTVLTLLGGPELSSDLVQHDGLSAVVHGLQPQDPSLILGQGTGPFAKDTAELEAFAAIADKAVPLATPLMHFGHTLGASGLLSVALGALVHQTGSAFPSLCSTATRTMDARRLNCRSGPLWPPEQNVLVMCRALNGACAATIVGGSSHANAQSRKAKWEECATSTPLMNKMLKRLAAEAQQQRPTSPPDLLIVRLEKALAPPALAIIGERLLPSAVLEITPGFASQLVARCWGFSGPALCLVGDIDVDPYGMTNVFRESGFDVFQVNLRGSGENRAIEWNV